MVVLMVFSELEVALGNNIVSEDLGWSWYRSPCDPKILARAAKGYLEPAPVFIPLKTELSRNALL
jgi:hypothetical protein